MTITNDFAPIKFTPNAFTPKWQLPNDFNPIQFTPKWHFFVVKLIFSEYKKKNKYRVIV